MTMNPEVKAQWLAALRGGEYSQAKSVLCQIDDDGSKSYCCLGVLSDLAVKAGVGTWSPKWSGESMQWLEESGDAYGAVTYMSETVSSWSGVAFDGELPKLTGGEYTLSALNDNGYTFEEIANIIEEQL